MPKKKNNKKNKEGFFWFIFILAVALALVFFSSSPMTFVQAETKLPPNDPGGGGGDKQPGGEKPTGGDKSGPKCTKELKPTKLCKYVLVSPEKKEVKAPPVKCQADKEFFEANRARYNISLDKKCIVKKCPGFKKEEADLCLEEKLLKGLCDPERIIVKSKSENLKCNYVLKPPGWDDYCKDLKEKAKVCIKKFCNSQMLTLATIYGVNCNTAHNSADCQPPLNLKCEKKAVKKREKPAGGGSNCVWCIRAGPGCCGWRSDSGSNSGSDSGVSSGLRESWDAARSQSSGESESEESPGTSE